MESDKPKYELHDMKPKYVLYFAIGLVLCAVVIQLVLWWLFELFVSRQARFGDTPTRIVTERAFPPEPRLQINPGADYTATRERAMQQLSTYGWLDKANGKARIPIERAMDIIAEQGLPVGTEENR
jgi:hypothetical protein